MKDLLVHLYLIREAFTRNIHLVDKDKHQHCCNGKDWSLIDVITLIDHV